MFWLAQPWLRPLGNLNLVIFFVGVVAAAACSPACRSPSRSALATFGYLALTTRTPLMVLVGRMDEGMSHLILLAVPLFVFLGLLIEMTGMARAMVAFLASLLGHVRGGLSLCAGRRDVPGVRHFRLEGGRHGGGGAGAVSGNEARAARKPGDLVALLAATGAQTETIPPSLVLITIGSVTGVSIAALFTGGLLPGVVLAITLCGAGVVALSRRGSAATSSAPRGGEIGSAFVDRPARAGAAVRDPRRGGRGRRDRDRSLDHRHRLCASSSGCWSIASSTGGG